MEIVLSPYQDPSVGLDWPEQTPIIVSALEERLKAWDEGALHYQLRQTNHGLGADWPTITLAILSVAGTAFFTIPAAHKKIRESIEEWKRIKANIEKLVSWVAPKNEVAAFSVELLFLDAVDQGMAVESSDLEFLGVSQLPIPSDISGGFTALKHYLFTFRSSQHIVLVAVNSGREVLWVRKVPV